MPTDFSCVVSSHISQIKLRIIRTFFFLTLLTSANFSFGQQEFLDELGTEKAESFRELMASYQNFLNTNFPNASSLGEQTRKFMMNMVNDEPLNYDSLEAINLITSLEKSGLRKEIYLYADESYDSAYNLRQFLTAEQADEIDEIIALNNREIDVPDSLKWKVFFQKHLESLPPEQRKKEEEMEARRNEGRKWASTTNPKSLYHYALLKTDTSFYTYCLIRIELFPAITEALTELSNDELETWNVQILFMVDYYLGNILFRYRRYMTGY